MTKKSFIIFAISIIFLNFNTIRLSSNWKYLNQEKNPNDALTMKMKEFFEKEKVTILITDSGLGGLSVFADIENRLKSYFAFKEVKLVFYNSCPESDIGFNKLKNKKDQINTFESALNGMIKCYNPDIILIACNTLSVLYPETEFSKSVQIPVIGIVDFGVDMIYQKMKDDKNSSAIIFASRTTVEANTHKNHLIARGISSENIFTQPCYILAGEIEKNSRSVKVKKLIEDYSSEVLQKMKDQDGKIYVGLFCTHYGYCSDIFLDVLKNEKKKNVEILDPNSKMSDFIFRMEYAKRYDNTRIKLEVASRAKIYPNEIKSIGKLIGKVSPPSEKSLQNYRLKKDLFIFDRKKVGL